MKKIYQSLFLPNRFFYVFSAVTLLFLLSFPFSVLMPLALSIFTLAIALTIAELFTLYQSNMRIKAQRQTPKIFSLSDQNRVKITIQNNAPIQVKLNVIDELPVQFQVRDFEKHLSLAPEEEQSIRYELRPVERGEYEFGAIHLFCNTRLGLLQRRITIDAQVVVPVYPSILQMKELELKAFDSVTYLKGVKKMRRIGHSYEFDHIKNYVRGDDYRSINWKASSRKAGLMVNKYEDERSQQVYNIIDKSRNMRMPFEGLSLMDYAINASLALSNIILKKHDRAGLLTFSDKMGSIIKADNRAEQLRLLLSTLYKEQERPVESNFELLYFAVRKLLTSRSLLLLYTNFESMYALDRTLSVLRKINSIHLLVVVFFENTEIKNFSTQKVNTLEDIYYQTIAQKFVAEKRAMAQKLRQYGIQSVLTRPQDLSLNTINKYLELKSRGLI